MARSNPTHVTRGNVLDDLGFSAEQATASKFKSDLHQAILKARTKVFAKAVGVAPGGASAPRERTAQRENRQQECGQIARLRWTAWD